MPGERAGPGARHKAVDVLVEDVVPGAERAAEEEAEEEELSVEEGDL